MYLQMFQMEFAGYYDPDADIRPDYMEQPKLVMSENNDERAKATLQNSNFWSSLLGIQLDCFTITQNGCTLEENFHPGIKSALRNIHQATVYKVAREYSSSNDDQVVEELSEDFSDSMQSGMDLIDFFREEGRNHPGLYYVSSYYLANGWGLEQVKEFQKCENTIKTLTEFHGNICNLYSDFLNNAIITDWEEHLT